MLVHSVYFWLKPGLTAEKRAEFRAGLERLRGIEAAQAVHVGTPAQTPARPVIDASYDFALAVLLEDLPGHDAYQAHPLHQDFVARFQANWERVLIFDMD